MKSAVKIFFISVFALGLFSCRKDIGHAEWDISVLTPLVNTTLGINNLLADSLIHQNPDTSLKLVYNTNLYSFSVDSIISVPDTLTYQVYNIPIIYTFQPGQLILANTDNKHLDFGDAGISKVTVKSGIITLTTKNTAGEKILCKYQIPCATLNGIPFEMTQLLPAAGANGASEFTKDMDISGYTINLTGPSGSSANVLTSVLKAWVDANGNPVTVSPDDSLIILTGFEGIIFDYAKGYFGSANFNTGLQSAAFGLFNQISTGSIKLKDIHANFNISNGFGVDATLLIQDIKSVNSRTGASVSLSSPVINSFININRALETGNPASPVLPSQNNFNLDNSNLLQFLENLPDRITYSLGITTNPLGNVSCGNDFIYNKYGLDANLNLEIPLSLIANNLTLCDTLPFNFSRQEDYEINYGTFTLLADNGFPFSAKIQLYLLDDNGAKTDSLIAGNNTVAPALLDANFKAISMKRSYLKIPVPAEKTEHLYNAKKIIIIARFNTAAQPNYVKIYSDYKLDMKLTGDFNMTVNKK